VPTSGTILAQSRFCREMRARQLAEKMVDRGRIELPTPGFSGLLTGFPKCGEVLDGPGRAHSIIMRPREPE
jgi:hypothetical protein